MAAVVVVVAVVVVITVSVVYLSSATYSWPLLSVGGPTLSQHQPQQPPTLQVQQYMQQQYPQQHPGTAGTGSYPTQQPPQAGPPPSYSDPYGRGPASDPRISSGVQYSSGGIGTGAGAGAGTVYAQSSSGYSAPPSYPYGECRAWASQVGRGAASGGQCQRTYVRFLSPVIPERAGDGGSAGVCVCLRDFGPHSIGFTIAQGAPKYEAWLGGGGQGRLRGLGCTRACCVWGPARETCYLHPLALLAFSSSAGTSSYPASAPGPPGPPAAGSGHTYAYSALAAPSSAVADSGVLGVTLHQQAPASAGGGGWARLAPAGGASASVEQPGQG